MSSLQTAADPIQPPLAARWAQLREEQPKLRIRDAAEKLGVSEAALVALGCGARTTRLAGSFGDLVKELPSLGPVMALTRNASAVHEKRGTYANVSVNGPQGLVLDEAIDLRIFFSHWHVGFAVREENREGLRRSLQFFNAQGTAVHKVYLENDEGVAAYERIAEQFRASDQSPVQDVVDAPAPKGRMPDEAIDVAGFRDAWRKLEDTHEFFGMLRKFGVERTQALRLADPEFARRVSNDSLRQVLEQAAATELPIMVFVGSPGCIQIHTGPVKEVRPMGPWMNVLDRDFNLHLREDHIAEAWVVRKPTKDGVVTSLELFDADGENIALLFGKRKPGIPESQAWRALASKLETFAHA